MSTAEIYATDLKRRIEKGQDGNDCLMYLAEQMSKETRQAYSDCKEMIAFYYNGTMRAVL